MSLFARSEQTQLRRVQPLAARLRPRSLEEFVGQSHLLGPGQLLRRLIDEDRLGSCIFHGPPGTGKTTLARLLAGATWRHFAQVNAVTHGVKELRALAERARDDVAAGGRALLLFVDEIHRFNRGQQDVLLNDVEEGIVSLVGATTSNPGFAVNPALLSRSQVFAFQPLEPAEVEILVRRALADRERGLGGSALTIDADAIKLLAEQSDGDARRALNLLEIAAAAAAQEGAPSISAQRVRQSAAERTFHYDVSGQEHYDCASALIKSLRGSDVDAAMYWLARMLEGGEDVRFLCRRLVILASEDIGNADPHALPLAVACFQACEQIGLPEAHYTLAQTAAYLACAPKSNAAGAALAAAREDVREHRVLPVPVHLCSTPPEGDPPAAAYVSPHRDPSGVVPQEYLGIDREYYHPAARGFELELARRLAVIRRQLRRSDAAEDAPSDRR